MLLDLTGVPSAVSFNETLFAEGRQQRTSSAQTCQVCRTPNRRCATPDT